MVTVIVPIYNQKRFLNRCIDSIIEQTYKDIEILLVDDGSTDGSDEICEQYKVRDSRVKVIHKPNGGLSSARNIALEDAEGDYITFVDSDDYLANDYVEKSINLCEVNLADISIMNMKYIPENMNEEISDEIETNVIILSPEQAIECSLYQILFSCCAPGKLYKKHIFEHIRFPLGKLSEDLAVCHNALACANKIVYSDKIGYYYRQQEKSIMHVFNPQRMDALQWALEIEEFCALNYPDILTAAKCRTFNVAVHLLLDISEKTETNYKFESLLKKEIKRTRMTVLSCHKVRLREKAAALLSFGGSNLLRRIWNSKLAVKKS
jgi:tagF domain-containing protein